MHDPVINRTRSASIHVHAMRSTTLLLALLGACRPAAATDAPPKIVAAEEVRGALDKDIIRNVVRSHIAEVRDCYNRGLARDHELEGRVMIQFTIAPDGNVRVAVVVDSPLPDDRVGKCIVRAVKRWRFPQPEGGGNVVVSYPFVFIPG